MKTDLSVGARSRASTCIAMLAVALGAAGLLACPRGGSGRNEPSPSTSTSSSTSSHVDEEEHSGIIRRIKLPESVVVDAKIRTEPVTAQRLAAVLALPGEVSVNPDRSSRVSSPIAGRLERVDFKEGTFVKKGDVLAVVRIPELGKLRAAYLEAITRAKAAKVTERREAELLAAHATSQREYLDAKTNAEITQAEADGFGSQLAALGGGAGAGPGLLSLQAPLAGFVLSRHAVVGQPVTADQAIGAIVDLSEVWFLARIFEKDLGHIAVGAKTEVVLNAYPKEVFVGNVVDVGREVDPIARTLTARIVLQNRADMLRIGLFGTAAVAVDDPTPSAPPVLVVPRSAITEIAGKSVVFVREPDGDFEMHDVVLGGAAQGTVEIVKGLRAGELVVVEGVFTLKSVALKSTMAED